MASGKINAMSAGTSERSRSPGSRPTTPVPGGSDPSVVADSDDGMAAGGPVRAVSVRRGRREAPEGASSGRLVPSSSSGRGQGRRKPEVYDISSGGSNPPPQLRGVSTVVQKRFARPLAPSRSVSPRVHPQDRAETLEREAVERCERGEPPGPCNFTVLEGVDRGTCGRAPDYMFTFVGVEAGVPQSGVEWCGAHAHRLSAVVGDVLAAPEGSRQMIGYLPAGRRPWKRWMPDPSLAQASPVPMLALGSDGLELRCQLLHEQVEVANERAGEAWELLGEESLGLHRYEEELHWETAEVLAR